MSLKRARHRSIHTVTKGIVDLVEAPKDLVSHLLDFDIVGGPEGVCNCKIYKGVPPHYHIKFKRVKLKGFNQDVYSASLAP